MPNVDELIRVREWARDQDKLALDGLPSEWDQVVWFSKGSWSCGSACCIAGKTALNVGARPVWKKYRDSTSMVEFNGEEQDVSGLARELLDISWDQAGILFRADNEFQDVEYIIDAIIANPYWCWDLDGTFLKMQERSWDD